MAVIAAWIAEMNEMKRLAKRGLSGAHRSY